MHIISAGLLWRRSLRIGVLAICLHVAWSTDKVLAAEAGSYADTAGWMDIDQLTQVRIVTVTRRAETVQQTAAAVSVISNDDLRRSGVNSLPEALRLVPGMGVARVNSSRYSVSARGFPGEFSDKLLVLMDGRSVYTPQFSGVFWDQQDVMLEDVDHIEVVRGPGGTAWGANAFNGVVNVVGKSARDTQGTLLAGGGGSFDLGRLGARYGGELGEHTWYRVFAQSAYRGETISATGTNLNDDWNSTLAGFRIDSEPSAVNSFTLLGGVEYLEVLQYANRQADRDQALGGHLLGRWRHTISDTAALEAQFYYDAVRRTTAPNPVNTDTADLDVRHNFALGERNRIQWGVNYRFIHSRTENGPTHFYDPLARDIQQVGLSVEDQITLVPEYLDFSAGCKLEYYSLTGWEPLPTARLLWTPRTNHSLWASVSRGVRTPSTADLNLTINTPFFVSIPNSDLPPEDVVAYQLGYRGTLADRLTLDLTGFFNCYNNLATYEDQGIPFPTTVQRNTNLRGEARGGAVALTWQAFTWWRWRASWGYLEMELHTKPGSTDTSGPLTAIRFPRNQASLWWAFQPASNFDLDLIARYVGESEANRVPAYFACDARIAWRPRTGLELALVGQNLFDPQHPEAIRSPGFPTASELPRSVFGKVTWSF